MPCAFSAAASARAGRPRQPDRVLRPHRGQAVRHRRHDRDVGEPFGVAAGHPVARVDLVGENLQLLDQHRGLHGVEPPGMTDANVVVFVGALAVHAQARKASTSAASSVITAPPSP